MKMLEKIIVLVVFFTLAGQAKALDKSMGFGLPLVFCNWGGSPCSDFNGVSYTLTADFLPMALLGHQTHLLSVGGTVIGLNDGVGAKYFGFGATVAAIEKAVGLTVGVMAYQNSNGVESGLIKGPKHMSLNDWWAMITYTINFALGPYTPPTGIAEGAQGLRKFNTVYIGW